MRTTSWLSLGVALLAGSLFLPASGLRSSRAGEPAVEFVPDVTFATVGGQNVRLDLARPKGLSAPAPAIVVIHGGGWAMGSRRQHDPLIRALAERGFVAVTVDYRLCPRCPWPAQLDDVRAAVRWLRVHAEEWQVDPKRIAALGFSAGAHLALLLGTMDAPVEGPSWKVNAVVSFFGPTDFTQDYGEIGTRLLDGVLGPAFSKDRRAASPIAYVDAADPPMLLFHGTQDPLVPYAQAVHMADALTGAGVRGRVSLLLGAGHGWLGATWSETQEDAIRFLQRELKASGTR